MKNNIILQAIILIVLGGAIGLADSAIRPVNISRKGPKIPVVVPEAPEVPANSGNGTSGTGTMGAPVDPVEPAGAQPTKPPVVKLPAGHIDLKTSRALYEQQAIFIDSRTVTEYEEGHIARAHRMDLELLDATTPELIWSLDPSEKIVVYCNGGNCDESELVARQLENSYGFENVYVFHDGYPAWRDAGLPVKTGPERE